MSRPIQLVYIPSGSEGEAVVICTALLEQQLVACGNIFATRSLYRWEGQLADEAEHVLLCKTLPQFAAAVEDVVRSLHSYSVPCVLRMEPAYLNDDYALWVGKSVAAPVVTASDDSTG